MTSNRSQLTTDEWMGRFQVFVLLISVLNPALVRASILSLKPNGCWGNSIHISIKILSRWIRVSESPTGAENSNWQTREFLRDKINYESSGFTNTDSACTLCSLALASFGSDLYRFCATPQAETSNAVHRSEMARGGDAFPAVYKCPSLPSASTQFIEWHEWEFKCHHTSNVSACFSSKSFTKWWVGGEWRCTKSKLSWRESADRWTSMCMNNSWSAEWCNASEIFVRRKYPEFSPKSCWKLSKLEWRYRGDWLCIRNVRFWLKTFTNRIDGGKKKTPENFLLHDAHQHVFMTRAFHANGNTFP